MSTTLLTLERNIAQELGYASIVPSSDSSDTVTIIDNSTDSPLQPEDSDSLFKNAWVKCEGDTHPTPQNVSEVRRIKAYTPSTGTITLPIGRGFTNPPRTTQTYGVYFGVPPGERFGIQKGLRAYINDVLRNSFYRTLALITLAPDGDMEATDTTDYSATNATLSKVTSGAGITHGKQALQVTTTADNGYCTLASALKVTEGEAIDVVVDCTPTSGNWKLQTWDVTTGVQIDVTDVYAGVQPRRLWLRSTVPTGCETLNVRLVGETNATVCVFDNLSIRRRTDRYYDLPSWLTNPNWLEEVWIYPSGAKKNEAYTIEDYNRVYPTWWRIQENRTALVPLRLELAGSIPPNAHLFISALRPFAELTADTATTDCNADYIKAWALAAIYADLEKQPEYTRWLTIARRLGVSYNPVMRRRIILRQSY